jgi:hypothetical protein
MELLLTVKLPKINLLHTISLNKKVMVTKQKTLEA